MNGLVGVASVLALELARILELVPLLLMERLDVLFARNTTGLFLLCRDLLLLLGIFLQHPLL
jgi:hypothetical protein